MQSRKLVFAVLTGFACLAVWPGALAVGPCAEGAKVQYPEGGTRQEGSQRENQRTRGRRQEPGEPGDGGRGVRGWAWRVRFPDTPLASDELADFSFGFYL